ncbi:MAG: transglutaminase-like cysteine peptidase [Alphaproteobacteria bacterium]|nr:transglutaminase-like cysteine peptidase [Alphaproteobacteria bacterium]
MTQAKKTKTGVLSTLKANLDRNRLGELLVANGTITSQQLLEALHMQKQTGFALGTVLKEKGLITTTGLRATLFQQMAFRALAAGVAFVIGFSALGIHTARATSSTQESIYTARKSMPEDYQPVSLTREAPKVASTSSYEPLFGTGEVRSADISPFTKWTGIMARLNPTSAPLPAALGAKAGASELEKVEAVNAYYNKVRYIEDKNNFGKSDYWETPVEFTSRGGDCEDFAIAKYAALKALGFSESQLRLAIVQDTWKGLPHAILIVYTADGAKFLDNQYKDVKDVAGFDRYRPVYSINRTGWWRHTS